MDGAQDQRDNSPPASAASGGQFVRRPVVTKVNNLRPEFPACRYNVAYICRRRSQLSTPHRSLVTDCKQTPFGRHTRTCFDIDNLGAYSLKVAN